MRQINRNFFFDFEHIFLKETNLHKKPVVVVSAFAGAPAGDVPAWAQAQDAMFADPEAGGSDKKAAPARPKAAPGTANHSVRPGSPFAHSCYTGDCPEPRNEKRFIVGLA